MAVSRHHLNSSALGPIVPPSVAPRLATPISSSRNQYTQPRGRRAVTNWPLASPSAR
jgi:hypothetical protein